MSKKGFLFFALGAAAAAAGVYLLKKNGGIHVSIDVEPSEASELDLELDNDLETVTDEDGITIDETDSAEPAL